MLEKKRYIYGMRTLPLATGVLLLFFAVLSSCREEDPVRASGNMGSVPTMVTYDVDTYISDSGYVKYHAITDIWEVYDDTVEPYWRFPHPLVVDVLSPGMKPHSHIECDSAVYNTSKRVFRFDGNVTAVNIENDTFLTPQLYWDQRSTEFYTDSFIHIVKSDRILEGYGFRSNEKMTRYAITNPTAILPASSLKSGGTTLEQRRDSADRETARQFGDPTRAIPVPASQRNYEAEQVQLRPEGNLRVR